MLNWKLIEYLVKKYQDQFTWSITTNGTLLTEEKIQCFKENNGSILWSIDGDKETQDYNRPLITGESSFDKIFFSVWFYSFLLLILLTIMLIIEVISFSIS